MTTEQERERGWRRENNPEPGEGTGTRAETRTETRMEKEREKEESSGIRHIYQEKSRVESQALLFR